MNVGSVFTPKYQLKGFLMFLRVLMCFFVLMMVSCASTTGFSNLDENYAIIIVKANFKDDKDFVISIAEGGDYKKATFVKHLGFHSEPEYLMLKVRAGEYFPMSVNAQGLPLSFKFKNDIYKVANAPGNLDRDNKRRYEFKAEAGSINYLGDLAILHDENGYSLNIKNNIEDARVFLEQQHPEVISLYELKDSGIVEIK